MTWSAAQYVKFEDERTRPVDDLIARIPLDAPKTVVDLGCGPGNSTERLVGRYPKAVISGLDSSGDMIRAARERLPDVAFEVADVSVWRPERPVDLLFANAVLQWVPDHAALFPALLERLAPGGVLAVQMPDNLDEPSHRLMREVAAGGPWAAKLGGAATAREPRREAEWFVRLLRERVAALDVWRTTYFHPIPGGAAGIVEWVKATGLRPFIQPLSDEERALYLARYETALAEAYPPLADGASLLPFPRLFIVAVKR